MGYSIQIKEAVLQKVLLGNKPHHEISQEFGVGRSTIGKWLRQYKESGNTTLKSKAKRPKDWSSEQRISALMETGTMTSEECVAWCRKNGRLFKRKASSPVKFNVSSPISIAISKGLKVILILPMECFIMSSAMLIELKNTSFTDDSSS
ncbi:helix-turn-helix domain-containing protein [Desulfobacter sp.]|uniref:helix-turn-helix domain-containing protein n=1 Tax=Desulfobacter sp. TaxID=2294 RepID=UPI00257955A5|nr:helix-turn-helix domain-containing protein [Desulfobacter sp.]